MNTNNAKLLLLLAICLPCMAQRLTAQPTAFTYQGRLDESGAPASGVYDFQFTLHDLVAGGNAVGNPSTNSGVTVSDGLFTVSLDFGSEVFQGSELWLQVGVRTGGSAEEFSLLNPRQPVSSVPYATRASQAGNAEAFQGAIVDSQLSANIPRLNASQQLLLNATGGIGINTDKPQSALHVNGTVMATGFSGNASGLTGLNAAGISSGILSVTRGGTGADLSRSGGPRQFVKQSTGGGAFSTGPIAATDIGSGSPGEGRLLVCDANGLPRWQSPSVLSIFFGQNYSVLIPDIIDNTAFLEIEGVMQDNVVIVNGPGLEIQRIPGFLGTNAFDQPGPNMEYPFVFEYSGVYSNALQTWHQQYTIDQVDKRAMSIIIKHLNGTEAGRWNLFEMGLTQITDGTDGRQRYTLPHGMPPDNRFFYERHFDTESLVSKNPETDLYRIEIEGVNQGGYPTTEIDYVNRTLTFVFDYAEAGGIYAWVRSTAQGNDSKRGISVITETNGVEVSRRNFYGTFPISFQQTTGFGQLEKLKETVVLSFDVWEDA